MSKYERLAADRNMDGLTHTHDQTLIIPVRIMPVGDNKYITFIMMISSKLFLLVK